jgi:Gpi18-like mannosyltransferase
VKLPPVTVPLATKVLLWVALGVGLLGARMALIPFQSGDYNAFLSPWFDAVSSAPWHESLANSRANYFPPYLYLIFIFTRLPLTKIVALKLIALGGDALLGASVFHLARARGAHAKQALLLAALVLALPTVIFDSAMWCQTDAIYCGFLLLALAEGIRQRGWRVAIFFASALAFKMQAIFFAPVLALFAVFGVMQLRQLAAIPVVHLAWMLPSLLLGAHLSDSYGMFATQANFYHDLQKNAPSLYQWIPQVAYDLQSGAGVYLALAAITIALIYAIDTTPAPLPVGRLIAWASFFLISVPFLLPKMHDRYFFVANVVSVVCAFVTRKWRATAAAILCNTASLLAYDPFLFQRQTIPLDVAALAMLLACALSGWVASEQDR